MCTVIVVASRPAAVTSTISAIVSTIPTLIITIVIVTITAAAAATPVIIVHLSSAHAATTIVIVHVAAVVALRILLILLGLLLVWSTLESTSRQTNSHRCSTRKSKCMHACVAYLSFFCSATSMRSGASASSNVIRPSSSSATFKSANDSNST